MSKQFSEFTLNFNSGARSNDKAPTDGEVPNAIQGFELKKLGTGRIFERTAEELNAGQATGKNLPRFYGHALVLLPSGPRYVDIAAWHRPEHNFYSGSAVVHNVEAAAEARAAGVGRPARAQRTLRRRR